MNKIKVKDFRELSKIDEVGTFDINGQTIEYKKFLTSQEKRNVILTVVKNSYNEKTRNIDEIMCDLIFKYMIITSYTTNISFPKKTFGEEKQDDIDTIVDVCDSSGIYDSLVENITNEYYELSSLLDMVKEEKLRENNISNFLFGILNEIKGMTPEKVEELSKQLNKIQGTEAYKNLIKK